MAKTVQHNICANAILLQSFKMLYLKINVGNELDIGKDGAFRPEACMPLYSEYFTTQLEELKEVVDNAKFLQ